MVVLILFQLFIQTLSMMIFVMCPLPLIHLLMMLKLFNPQNVISVFYTDCPLEWCTAHIKCPPGKYTKQAGTVIAQPECETCPDGFFKPEASYSSIKTDSCTAHKKCPPGEYALTGGSVTGHPKCGRCAPGFFKALSSGSSTDACIAHTKCPPGKFTSKAGSATAEPNCTVCPPGFFTNSNSKLTQVSWYIGNKGQNCRDVCGQVGGSCDNGHWPQSLTEFGKILQEIGNNSCSSIRSGTYPGNPIRSGTMCYWKGDSSRGDRCLKVSRSDEKFCPCINAGGKGLGTVELYFLVVGPSHYMFCCFL